MSSSSELPDEIAVKRTTRFPRARGCLIKAALCFSVALLVGILIWAVQGRRQLTHEIELIRSAGEPLSVAELETYYQIPDGVPDVTAGWLPCLELLAEPKLVEKLAALPFYRKSDPFARDPPPPPLPLPSEPWPDMEQVQSLLEPQLMERLHAAAQPGAARFPVSFADGHEALTDSPHRESLRTAAKLFELEAFVAAHRGNLDDTAKSLHALFNVSQCLEFEPLLISSLNSQSHSLRAQESLHRLLPQVSFSDDHLRSFQRQLRRDFLSASRRALIGERGVIYNFIVNSGTRLSGATWEDQAKFLEIMRGDLAAFQQPFPQGIPELERYHEGLETFFRLSRVFPRRYLFTNLMTPATEAFLQSAAMADVGAKVLDTALGVILTQRLTGSYPTSLDELTGRQLPEVYQDPFSGQPLRYKRIDNGFVVYSFGRNRTDDNADESKDIVAKYSQK